MGAQTEARILRHGDLPECCRAAGPGDGWALGAIFEPAGDYSLSLADYAKSLQFHLAGLTGRDGLLMASSIQRLHAGSDEYAMGWSLRELDRTVALWNTGAYMRTARHSLAT